MLNVDVARNSLQNILLDRTRNETSNYTDIGVLRDFIDEVERLLHYNAIKQTPALFKVTKL